jgi:5-methylcytosine-specific restriction endonuclease McrA
MPKKPSSSIPDWQWADICTLYIQGRSENALAQQFAVSRSVIRRILCLSKIEPRDVAGANQLMMQQRTPEEHRRNTVAAQAAWKNRPHAGTNLENYRAYQERYRSVHREGRNALFRAYHQSNSVHRNAARRKHYQENLVHHKKRMQAYHQSHKEQSYHYRKEYRARKAGALRHDLSLQQWREIKEHYQYCCVYCGRKLQHLTMDHIVPLSKGGSHTASNVVPACHSCNSRKNVGPPLVPVQPLLLEKAGRRPWTSVQGGMPVA